MAMERFSRTPSVPLSTGRAPTSTPLMDVQFFRPGPYLALALLLLPVAATLTGAAIALGISGSIPLWLPLILLIWLPCLPIIWWMMQSARTTSSGLAVGRPWRTWQEMPWELVERVEQRGLSIRLIASDGQRLTVTPFLLREGSRLQRQLFLRLPTQVFIGSLNQEARDAVTGVGGIVPLADGGLVGTMRAHPRTRWYALLGGVCLLCLALLIVGFLKLPLGLAILLGIVCLAILIGSCYMLVRLLQRVRVDEHGVEVRALARRQARLMPWSEVELIYHTPHEAFLRLQGDYRLVCIGPGLLSPTQRDLMRAFIHQYCISRGATTVKRMWLL